MKGAEHNCQLDHFYSHSSHSFRDPRAVMARKDAHEEMLFHEGRMIIEGCIRELKIRHMGVGVYEFTLVPKREKEG